MALAYIGVPGGSKAPVNMRRPFRGCLQNEDEEKQMTKIAALLLSLFAGSALALEALPSSQSGLASGASDAWVTPITMKKSRPGITLSALCSSEREAAITEIFLRETTTLGLRRREVGKIMLERTTEEIATSLGSVRVKTGWLDGRAVKSKPEHEDLRRIATERGLPLREVEQTVLAEIARRNPTP